MSSDHISHELVESDLDEDNNSFTRIDNNESSLDSTFTTTDGNNTTTSNSKVVKKTKSISNLRAFVESLPSSTNTPQLLSTTTMVNTPHVTSTTIINSPSPSKEPNHNIKSVLTSPFPAHRFKTLDLRNSRNTNNTNPYIRKLTDPLYEINRDLHSIYKKRMSQPDNISYYASLSSSSSSISTIPSLSSFSTSLLSSSGGSSTSPTNSPGSYSPSSPLSPRSPRSPSSPLPSSLLGEGDIWTYNTMDHLTSSLSTPQDSIDRSDWQTRVLQSNPELKGLRERVKPLSRVLAFQRLYNPGKKQVKDRLTRELIIQLVMQHLYVRGLHGTLKIMEQETGITYSGPTHLFRSQIEKFSKRAVKDIERLFELSMGEKIVIQDNNNESVETDEIDESELSNILSEEEKSDIELEELLFDLGLLDDAYQQMTTIRKEDDTNIWLEPDDHIIIDQNKQEQEPVDLWLYPPHKTTEPDEENVKAGTLNKLVQKLTSENKHDLSFTKTFLMTYQTFTTPQQLFDKLLQRYNVPPNYKSNQEDRTELTRRIRLRVCNVLKSWIDEYFGDFDAELLQKVKNFVQEMRLNGENALASALQNSLSKHTKQTKTALKIMFDDKPPEPHVPKNIFSASLNFFDIEEEEMARQMTIIEFEIFSNIKPCELLNQSWNKAKLKHKAPNVLALIERFNTVSMWVGTMIISQQRLKPRAKIMAQFIRLAKQLRNLNNFNSLTAIIAGLNFASVHRLRFTWDSLPAGILPMYEELEKVMSSEGAYKSYRESLKGVLGPCIPYLGVHLTDLTFIDENPDYVELPQHSNNDNNNNNNNNNNNSNDNLQLINFGKRKLIYTVISQLQEIQQRPYNLQPVYQIASFLKKLSQMDDQTLYRLSLEREPRKAKISDILQ